jgi:hypothetical protein
MHQRDAAIKAWEDAGLFRTGDRRLRELLERIRTSSVECWPELVELVREEYASYKERIVRPLWESGDTLLRVNLIRAADPKAYQDEAGLLARFAKEIDPQEHEHEVLALARAGGEKLRTQLAKRKDMPPRLAAALGRAPGAPDVSG